MTMRNATVPTVDAIMAKHGDVQVMPASYAQRRFWLLDQLDGGAAAYTIPLALRLRGALNVQALEEALNVIVERHESLRTVFAMEDGDTVQVVLPKVAVSVSRGAAKESDVLERAARNADATFDLATGPLIRAELLSIGPDDHVLLLTMHHIVADGWSMGVLFSELEQAYAARVAGSEPTFKPLPLQYADFAVWQMNSGAADAGAMQVAWWKEHLRDLPTLDLATDHARPAIQTANGNKRETVIPADIAGSVRALARREGATPYMTFLAAWIALLHRYAGQDDVVVGSITSGRLRAEVEQLIGPFVNTLAIRTDLSGDPTFTDVLGRVRESATGAMQNQDVPFEQVVEAVQPTRDRSRSPIFQVAFQLLEGLARELSLPGVTATRIAGAKSTTKFELTLVVNVGDAGALRGVIEYNTDLFDAPTIDRMLAHYVAVLRGIIADPRQKVSAIPLMDRAERDRVATRWNATEVALPDWTVAQRTLAIAKEEPEGIAVRGTDGTLSYRELARRSAIVAQHLKNAGVAGGDRVAVCVDRTTLLSVALLGVHRADAAYVPIDASYPAERIAQVSEDAGVRVILTDSASRPSLPATATPVIVLGDEAWGVEVSDAAAFDAPDVEAESLAYVLYTSGSTGRPKGVMIPHRALSNFLASMAVKPGFRRGDSLIAVTTVAFDIAGLELWLPLISGGTVVIASRATAIDGHALRSLINETSRQSRTMLQATPATWRLLLEAGWSGTPNLVMLCGGEAWPAGLAEALVAKGESLWNMYGPTETTIWSSIARVTNASLSLGEPIANTTLHVLERAGALAPLGVPGELWIGGAGLAIGYHGREDLTAERFVQHPELGRLYRTGDRVQRRTDGSLVYLGRLDDQVKVRGYRIELGDIEAALASSPDVTQAAAFVHRSADGNEAQIVGYVIAAPSWHGDDAALARQLTDRVRKVLPDYMVPSAIVRLDTMPLTPNGKVNRRALPAPTSDARVAREYVAPRSPLEQQVANAWAAVLRVERVGIEDDFFSLGGHSLAAMRVIARLSEAFPIRLTIGAMFEARTVAALAAIIAQKTADATANEQDDLAALLAELEGMSDEEATRMLTNDAKESA